MSRWRNGDFHRHRISPVFHPFTPAHAVETLHSIDLQRLWDRGKRLLLLDVDNTMVQWRQENFSPEILAWISKAKEMGFGICIISNTNRLDRLARIKETLGVETVRGRFKPSAAMFRLALIKFKCTADQAVMVGDQMMTDILGANRAGIDAIWVRKMEGAEFGPTAINRFIERILTGIVYRGLVAPIDEPQGTALEEAQKAPGDRAIVHQIVKFLVVGITSFVIDYSIRMTLLFAIPYGNSTFGEALGRWLQATLPAIFAPDHPARDAAFPICATVAASFAILNSFIWNRMWTFQIRGREERVRQLQRFILISIVGLALNVLIGSLLNHLLPGDDKMRARVATVLAAGIVAVWNFLGQRYFAFRTRTA